jgi:hypothetical protein
MAYLVFSTKELMGYRLKIEEPIRPFALNYLAASGLFDKISIVTDSGIVMTVEGADLLHAADVVGVKEGRKVDPPARLGRPTWDPDHHCTDVNCRHSNHRSMG